MGMMTHPILTRTITPQAEMTRAREVLVGHLDRLAPGCVCGWARHDGRNTRPVTLLVLADGELVGRVLANAYRADLAAAGHGFGRHGFELEAPELASGSVVEVLRETDGAPLPGGPFVISRAGDAAD